MHSASPAVMGRVLVVGNARAGKYSFVSQAVRLLSGGGSPPGKALSRSSLNLPLPNGSAVSCDLWHCPATPELVSSYQDNGQLWRAYVGDAPAAALIVMYSDRSLDEIDAVTRDWLEPLNGWRRSDRQWQVRVQSARGETSEDHHQQKNQNRTTPPASVVCLVLNRVTQQMPKHHSDMLKSMCAGYACQPYVVNCATGEGVRELLCDVAGAIHYHNRGVLRAASPASWSARSTDSIQRPGLLLPSAAGDPKRVVHSSSVCTEYSSAESFEEESSEEESYEDLREEGDERRKDKAIEEPHSGRLAALFLCCKN